MSRWWRGEAVAIQAQAYQRSPLEPFPSGADLPAPLVLQQRLDRLRAGQLGARGQGEGEIRRHPQDIRLAARLEEHPQLGAAAIDLIPAGKVERQAVRVRVGADIDRQLPLGPEPQVQRQPHDQGPDRVGDVLAGDPLPGADQRVPGLVPHAGQVHGVDPVGHPSAHPMYWRLTPGGGLSRFFLPGLVDRADHHPAPPPAPRRLLQALGREPAHHAHRGGGVPARVVQKPLRPVRRPVPAMPGDAPPVHPGSSLTSADTYLPACSHGSVRAKHGRSSPSSSSRFRSASPAPIRRQRRSI